MNQIEKDKLLELANTLNQAILEMNHAHANPNFFTKGREGAEAQFRLWKNRGQEAVIELKVLING